MSEYDCAICGETFEYLPEDVWSDRDARAEYEENFGTAPIPTTIVCDGCYEELMADLTGGQRPVVNQADQGGGRA